MTDNPTPNDIALLTAKEALRKISHLRPMGDVETCKQPRKLIWQMERIAIEALATITNGGGNEG